MSRPRLLDLYCGAGGAAVGYSRAGFDVVGVDIAPQPRYPFEFVQADALAVLAGCIEERMAHFPLWEGFAAIHASPPCQAYTTMRVMPNAREHPELVEPTRELLVATGLPWVMENVPGAPLAVHPPSLLSETSGVTDGLARSNAGHPSRVHRVHRRPTAREPGARPGGTVGSTPQPSDQGASHGRLTEGTSCGLSVHQVLRGGGGRQGSRAGDVPALEGELHRLRGAIRAHHNATEEADAEPEPWDLLLWANLDRPANKPKRAVATEPDKV